MTSFNLSLCQGSDYNISLSLTNNDLSAINLSGYNVEGYVKSSYSSSTALLNLNPLIVNAASGIISISVPAYETINLPINIAYYTINIFNESHSLNVLNGNVLIYPSVFSSGVTIPDLSVSGILPIYNFSAILNSGITSQFINYPTIFNSAPNFVDYSFENNIDNYSYSSNISGINNSGFYINFSDSLKSSGYILLVEIGFPNNNSVNNDVFIDSFYPLNSNPAGYITNSDLNSYYPNSNPSGFVTGIDANNLASITNLNSTGSYLFNLINASNAGVSSINLNSGILTFTGAGNISIITNGQTFNISGNTGIYSTFVTTGQTGQFGNSNLNNIVFTTGNQNITGIKNFNSIMSVSAISGNSNYAGGLIDSNGIISNNWNTRALIDGSNVQSITYDSRILKDAFQNYSIEWGNRFLRDAAQNYVLDWNNKSLSGNWTQNSHAILNSLDSGNIQSQINIKYSSNNPSGFITGFNSGLYVLNANTGVFITTGQTGSFGNAVNTGILTGVFYPLHSNPSGYLTAINTGNFNIIPTLNNNNITIGSAPFYVFTGNSPIVWTLPLINNSTGNMYFLKNRGSATITLSGNGSDNIYTDSGVNTLIINPGEAYTIANCGYYWDVI